MEFRFSTLIAYLFTVPLSIEGLGDIDDVVKDTLNNISRAMTIRGISKLTIPDMRADWMVGRLSISDGQLANISSLVIHEGDQRITKTESHAGTVYEYQVFLGLEECHLSYRFICRLFPLVGADGGVDVGVKTDTVRLRGRIKYNQRGLCLAALDTATLMVLDDFDVVISPDNLPRKIASLIFNVVNHFLRKLYIPIVNIWFQSILLDSKFIGTFTDVVCEAFVPSGLIL